MTTTADNATITAVDSVSHLTPERWAIANRHLVRKAIAEFSHERILVPEADPRGGSRRQSVQGSER